MKKTKYFGIIIMALFLFSLISCANKNNNNNNNINEEIYAVYLLGKEEGLITDSYEEWLYSIKGEQGLPGEDGKSAYQIYLEYYPKYKGTEKEWLDDLVNGRLKDAGSVEDYRRYFYGVTSIKKRALDEKPIIEETTIYRDKDVIGYAYIGLDYAEGIPGKQHLSLLELLKI
jgi:hypothetical protein